MEPTVLQKAQAIESLHLDKKDLTKGVEIGRGGMARVFKGKWRDMDVAIKQCEANNNKQAQQMATLMEAEIRIHVKLSHVNILPLFGFVRDGKDVLVVSELMDMALDTLIYPKEGPCILEMEKKLFIIKEFLR